MISLSPAPSNLQCQHCRSAIPQGRNGGFCCQGCESVYGILQKAGLSEYYRIKEEGICFRDVKPIQKKISRFEFFTDSLGVNFYLEGVHCSACLWLLERLPQVRPQWVQNCSLNLNTSVLKLTLTESTHVNSVAQIISDWGYTPHLMAPSDSIEKRIQKENRHRLLDLGIAGAIAGNIMLMSIPLYSGVSGSFATLFEGLSFLLAIPSLFYSGRSFFKNVASGFKSGTFPIDAPILLALLTAFFYSTYSLWIGTHELYFDSLSALIFLLLGSRYYLARLRQSSRMNLGVLEFFQTKTEFKPGDFVPLKPDEPIQFDGVVRSGEGWCDFSQFTGESEPVKLQVGDPVYAGTRFMSSEMELWVEVQKTGNDTRLAKLLTKVTEIQSRRTRTEWASDQWSKSLLMIVLVISFLSITYFISQGIPAEGIKRVLALLIVTCPCALALATPLVFTLAMKSLLKKGLLVKDPAALDQMAEVKSIYFDKTGTLTEGNLEARFHSNELSSSDQSVLISMVRRSRHPVSRSIEKTLVDQGWKPKSAPISSFEEKPGQGIFCTHEGIRYALIRAPESKSGLTENSFLKDGQEISRIVFEDHLRSEARSVTHDLLNRGYEVNLLSGDHPEPVLSLARELSLSRAFYLKSPEEKAVLVRDAMMIGDGVNDALALSEARVSFAVQGGMEAAIQSAQVFSLKPGIRMVGPFLDVAKKVRKTLRQNFAFSLSYNILGAILSLTGWMTPLIAALLMPASALTVFWSSVIRFKETE